MDQQGLQQHIGYSFSNMELLNQALTHRSHGPGNNERLEFLGDSLLNTVISQSIFARFPQANEGRLSRTRAHLVRRETLAHIARQLGLPDVLRLGVGELKSGGCARDNILADAFEALVAAIYLDCSCWQTLSDVLNTIFAPFMDKLSTLEQLKDAKSLLQEWLQARHLPLPNYQQLGESDNHASFDVACHVEPLDTPAKASASTKRHAEQQAAAKALEKLKQLHLD